MIRSEKYRGVERHWTEGSPWRAVDHFQGVSNLLGEYTAEEEAALAVDDLLVRRRGIIAAYQTGELNLPEHPLRREALAMAQAEDEARRAARAKAEEDRIARAMIAEEIKPEVWESWITGREDVPALARRLFVSQTTVSKYLKERAQKQFSGIGITLESDRPNAGVESPTPKKSRWGA